MAQGYADAHRQQDEHGHHDHAPGDERIVGRLTKANAAATIRRPDCMENILGEAHRPANGSHWRVRVSGRVLYAIAKHIEKNL
jgi:hypothetical protein